MNNYSYLSLKELKDLRTIHMGNLAHYMTQQANGNTTLSVINGIREEHQTIEAIDARIQQLQPPHAASADQAPQQPSSQAGNTGPPTTSTSATQTQQQTTPAKSTFWQWVQNHPLVITLTILSAIVSLIVSMPLLSSPNSGPAIYNGHVLTTTGEPIPAAEVSFTFGNSVPKIDYTDSNGVYSFMFEFDETKTSGDVRVRKNGFRTEERKITIERNQSELEDIRMEQE